MSGRRAQPQPSEPLDDERIKLARAFTADELRAIAEAIRGTRATQPREQERESCCVFCGGIAMPLTIPAHAECVRARTGEQERLREALEDLLPVVGALLRGSPVRDLDERIEAARTALDAAPSQQRTQPEPSHGQKMYEQHTANHPTIHANRFAAWSELSQAQRDDWERSARSRRRDE